MRLGPTQERSSFLAAPFSGLRKYVVALLAVLLAGAGLTVGLIAGAPPAVAQGVTDTAAWGSNSFGQLGNGTFSNSSTPVTVKSHFTGATAVAGGAGFTLARKSDGTVWAWGLNDEGELGIGTSTGPLTCSTLVGPVSCSPTPVQVHNLTGVTAVAAGAGHGLALKSDGTVWAWGGNSSGQLGIGTSDGPQMCPKNLIGSVPCSTTPVQVNNLTGITAVAAGTSHSLAVKSGGTGWAWGYNAFGQLGIGTSTGPQTCDGFPCSTNPVQVQNLTGATAVAAGQWLSVARKSDGTVRAWGYNRWGQLGVGTSTGPQTCVTNEGTVACSTTPVQVQNLTGATAVAAGAGFGLARKSDGTVRAWGANSLGQLGTGTTTGPQLCSGFACSTTPVQVTGLISVTAVAAGDSHSLALKSDGTVWAWGYNDAGQLGNGTTANSSTPVHVAGLIGVEAVAAGSRFSLAVFPQRAYFPLTPARITDTRPGSIYPNAGHTLGPGATLAVQVTGAREVPTTGVAAAVLNVTATDPTQQSYLTVWPTGTPRPTASNLNFLPGQTVPNLVQVGLGSAGQVNIYNPSGSVNVVVDVEGYVGRAATSGSGLYNALTPRRITDTRPDSIYPNAGHTLGPGAILNMQVSGQGGVPPDGAQAAVLNVTATNPTQQSYLTVWPTGTARPTASNLNFVTGQTVPNRVIVRLGTGGQVSIYNPAGSVDVVVDVGGYFTDYSNPMYSGAQFTPSTPARITDTRPDSGYPNADGRIGSGGAITVQVTGQGGVPVPDVTAAVMNVTATSPTEQSYLTVWPYGFVRPPISDLNFVPGQTVANLVPVKLVSGGRIDVYNAAGWVDVVVDVSGWYATAANW